MVFPGHDHYAGICCHPHIQIVGTPQAGGAAWHVSRACFHRTDATRVRQANEFCQLRNEPFNQDDSQTHRTPSTNKRTYDITELVKHFEDLMSDS